MEDDELLRRFTQNGSEDAFRRLVERHGGLVYSVAMRRLGRPHQAEEVTHAVFAALAKKAATLSSATILVGWLFRATRFAAAKLQRDEERRQRLEREAATAMTTQFEVDSRTDWEHIVPLLDSELESLSEKDRDAVLLRFFENHSFKEVGLALGTSEDAAKMRVSRALDKLRRRFFKRGVALSAAVLTNALSNEAQASTTFAPSALAKSLARACLEKNAASSLAEAITRKVAWWKWKPLLIKAGVVVIGGTIAWSVWQGRSLAPKAPAKPTWPARK